MKFKHMMDLHLFDESGEGGASGRPGVPSGEHAGSASGGSHPGGTFTYEQLNEIATNRAEQAEKQALRNFFKTQGLTEQEAKSALEKYRNDKASRQPNIAQIEQERDSYRKQLEERDNRDYLRDKKVSSDDLDYVAFKVGQMVDDKTDFKKAADKFLKENPRYCQAGYRVDTSTSSGGEGSTESKYAGINDLIRRAARR